MIQAPGQNRLRNPGQASLLGACRLSLASHRAGLFHLFIAVSQRQAGAAPSTPASPLSPVPSLGRVLQTLLGTLLSFTPSVVLSAVDAPAASTLDVASPSLPAATRLGAILTLALRTALGTLARHAIPASPASPAKRESPWSKNPRSAGPTVVSQSARSIAVRLPHCALAKLAAATCR